MSFASVQGNASISAHSAPRTLCLEVQVRRYPSAYRTANVSRETNQSIVPAWFAAVEELDKYRTVGGQHVSFI